MNYRYQIKHVPSLVTHITLEMSEDDGRRWDELKNFGRGGYLDYSGQTLFAAEEYCRAGYASRGEQWAPARTWDNGALFLVGNSISA